MPSGRLKPAIRNYSACSERLAFAFSGNMDDGQSSGSVLGLARLAHVALRVKLQAKLVDEIELGFEEVDVAFFVGHQFLEQVA